MKPGAVDRFRHRVSPRELVPHPLRTVRSRIRFRRDASEGFEDPMEVKAAHAGGGGERLEVRHVLSGLDQMASLRHHRGVLFGERRFSRSAPLQGRKPACSASSRVAWKRTCSRRASAPHRMADNRRQSSAPNNRTHRPRRDHAVPPPAHRASSLENGGEVRAVLSSLFHSCAALFFPHRKLDQGLQHLTPSP